MRMQRPWLLVVAAVLAVALAVLATLQYRWISDLSAADEQRQRGALDVSVRHFADDVTRECIRPLDVFDQAPRDPAELVRRYEEWRASARDAGLIEALYVAESDGGTIARLDTRSGRLVPADWTPALDPVRSRLRAGPDAPPLRRRPVIAQVPALVIPLRPEPRRGPPPDDANGPPPWFGGGPPPEREPAPPRPPRPAFLIATLDRAALANVVRDFAARAFPDNEVDVAVVAGDDVVFRNGRWPASAREHAEAVAPLLAIGPMRDPDAPPAYWKLLVRRHGAPLADVVATTRRRNLGVSFAILALLLGSFVLLAVLARRAERLRMQQLEFVAGITHELNTPLAALRSAGQNLADGIVADPAQVARYGGMVVKESRRLSETVAQVLDFAGMQARPAPPRLERVDVGRIVEEAVAQCGWLAEEAAVKIETSVADDVRAVDGDADALTRAVQNLVANAIRHGGEGGWVGVRAAAEGGGVAITVEDRGPGVAARDIPHLFDPFFRGRGAERTRGSGLGLTIVQQIAAAHGGTVEVARRRQRGAAFTLRIPARGGAAVSREVQHA
jgi:signal transduction histidine kinase